MGRPLALRGRHRGQPRAYREGGSAVRTQRGGEKGHQPRARTCCCVWVRVFQELGRRLLLSPDAVLRVLGLSRHRIGGLEQPCAYHDQLPFQLSQQQRWAQGPTSPCAISKEQRCPVGTSSACLWPPRELGQSRALGPPAAGWPWGTSGQGASCACTRVCALVWTGVCPSNKLLPLCPLLSVLSRGKRGAVFSLAISPQIPPTWQICWALWLPYDKASHVHMMCVHMHVQNSV